MRDSTLPVLLAALAGGVAVLAVCEAVLALPQLGRRLSAVARPLLRAGREGYDPTLAERRRLTVLGTAALIVGALLLGGPVLIPVVAGTGPILVAHLLARRRERFRAAVELALPEISRAIADGVASGRSVRAALASATTSLDGVPAAELSRVAADLELGVPTRDALEGLRVRLRSPRVDALAAALAFQQRAGGDLAALLRRFAAASADRDRARAEARAATVQARFTGLLVVAMPTGAALFAELLRPGFVGGVLSTPVAGALLGFAAILQVLGFAVIRRVARVEAP